MRDVTLETERLILRPPVDSDLDWQLQWLNTPAVMRYLGGAPRTIDQVTAGFERNRAAWLAAEPAFWTVTSREGGEPIGRCGLSRIVEEPAPAEIRGAIQVGWSLAERFWGQGYASEAARAVIRHCFECYPVHEIWGQISDSNGASTRLMGRLGLRLRADLCYFDPDYPASDNPTTVHRLGRAEWSTQE